MYSKKVLHYSHLFLKLCNRIASISMRWDPSSQRLSSVSRPALLRQFRLHILIAIVHNIFLVLSLLLRDIPKFGVAYHMLAIYFTIGYIMCNGCRVVCWINEKEIIKLVNAQIDFEKSLSVYRSFHHWHERAKEPSTKRDSIIVKTLEVSTPGNGEKFERNLLVLGIITGISVPTLVFLIIMAHPCLPPFIGSIIFEYKGNHCYTLNWWSYVGLGVLNFWMHLDMVLPFVFSMFGLFFMSIALLQDYLLVIKRNFPLYRIHIRSDFEGPAHVYKAPLQLYRCLQILEKQLNICFRGRYFPLFLGGMTALLIFCLHACIRLPGKIPMPGFSYFPIVAFDGIISLLVMNTRAANVREHSFKIIREWANSPRLLRKHWVKKMARSFIPLKIQLGSNFVDQLTPLVIINFTVNQVVSLLLLGGSEHN